MAGGCEWERQAAVGLPRAVLVRSLDCRWRLGPTHLRSSVGTAVPARGRMRLLCIISLSRVVLCRLHPPQ